MPIVIAIDENLYERVKDKNSNLYDWTADSHVLREAVANGTPLPKSHGRLIDESEITELYTYVPNRFCTGGGWKTENFTATSTNAPTLVEAATEVEADAG